MMKAQRLWREELLADRGQHGDDSGARAPGEGGVASWKAKKKAKPKNRAAAGSSGDAA